MPDQSFLGTGMKFPPQINPATGRVETSDEATSVRESIYIILMTARSERIVRPWFGTNMNQFIFADINYTTLNIISRELSESILSQEPRVARVEVNPEPDLDNGRLIMNIDYYLSGSHQQGNLVFPFYLQMDEAVEEELPEDAIDDYDAGADNA